MENLIATLTENIILQQMENLTFNHVLAKKEDKYSVFIEPNRTFSRRRGNL